MIGVDLELDRHQAQRERDERALVSRQLNHTDSSAADFSEWPVIKKPFRAVNRFPVYAPAGRDCFSSNRAKLNIVQHNPTFTANVGREPKQIEQRQWMAMVCVNKGDL